MSEITYPEPVKHDFARQVQDRIERASKAVEKAYSEFVTLYRPKLEKNVRNDALGESELREKVREYIRAAHSSFIRIRDEDVDRQLVINAVEEVDKYNREELFKKFKDELQISALPQLIGAAQFSAWIQESVDRIKTLEDEFFDGVLDAIEEGIRRGDRPESIAEKISDITGRDKHMAELLARDQFGDLNAKVNEKRQSDLGIEEYIWQNSSDSRVRALHKNSTGIGGETFTWASGGHRTEGHPGEPYNCRCTPDAVIRSARDLVRNDSFTEHVDFRSEPTHISLRGLEVED